MTKFIHPVGGRGTLAMPRTRTAPKVVDVPLDGPPVPRFPKVTREVRESGLRFIMLPPGETTVRYRTEVSFIDVNLNAVPLRLSWNSDRLTEITPPVDSLAFVPVGGEFMIDTVNVLPGLLVEIEPDYWPDSLHKTFGFGSGASGFGGDGSGGGAPVDFLTYQHDPVAAELGRAGMRLLMEDARSGEKADTLALEGIALGLIGRVAKRLEDDRSETIGTPTPPALARRRLRAVTEYVEANLADTIQVADLAQLVGMSVSHFARSFKLAMGVGPARYVVIRRIERAKLLLAQGELPIVEVAFACGFSGQAHFTRTFHDATGMPPGKFRKAAK